MADCSAIGRDPRRVCRVCFREFPSGYALGGHMRVHGVQYAEALLEKERKQQLTQKTTKNNTIRVSLVDDHQQKQLVKKLKRPLQISSGSSLADDVNDVDDVQDSWWMDGEAYPGTSSFDAFSYGFNPLASKLRGTEEKAEFGSANNCVLHSNVSHSCIGNDGAILSRKKLLYELRRNPKPSHRLTDREFAFEEQLMASGAAPNMFCSECGKVFWSERALFGHMRCHTGVKIGEGSSTQLFIEDAVSDADSKEGENDDDDDENDIDGRKESALQLPARGKRSKMTRKARRIDMVPDQCLEDVEPDTASSEIEEDPDIAACVVLLSMAAGRSMERCHQQRPKHIDWDNKVVQDGAGNHDQPEAKFECTSCKRRFTSPQALGGHRASHKKTKGCFARTIVPEDDSGDELEVQLNERSSSSPSGWQRLQSLQDKYSNNLKKQKVVGIDKLMLKGGNGHECSICHRVFPTGQALGGHKRCHWVGEKPVEVVGSGASVSSVALPTASAYGRTHLRKLDLNFCASSVDDEEEEEVRIAVPAIPADASSLSISQKVKEDLEEISEPWAGAGEPANGGIKVINP